MTRIAYGKHIEEAEKDLLLGEKALEKISSEANNKENCERKNEPIQGAKHDSGKPNLSTVPTGIIYAIERVRAYGFAKYKEAETWKSIDPKRWHEAFLRHTLKIWEDPAAIDPESGLPHLWHIATNVDFLIESLGLTPEKLVSKKED